MVRVLVVADEVVPTLYDTSVRRLAPDLVLGAGDLPWAYLEFLADALDVPVVFVPGNHDPAVPRSQGPCDLPRPAGAECADGRVVEAAGLRIAGLGGCVRYNRGPNQYTQAQYARRARALHRAARRADGPVDVLLTHAPPYGLGDEPDACHQGIEALHGTLEALTPTWHLHGHVHPYGHARPDRTRGRTTLRNVVPWTLLEIAPRDAAVPLATTRGR